MKFCTNCGNPLGTEKFCTKCGAKVEDSVSEAPVATVSYASMPRIQSNKKSMKKIVIPAIVVVLAAVLAFTFLGGRSYKSVIKSYAEASNKMDAKKIVSLLPDEMIDYMMDEGGYTSKKEFIDHVQDMMNEQYSSYKEQGIDIEDIKISYEIEEEEDLRGDDWRETRDILKEEAGIEIDAAKEIELKLHGEYLGKDFETNYTLNLVKIGRSWYLIGL